MYKVLNRKLWHPPCALSKLLLVMRLTTLILIVGIMQVSAAGFAQKVSVNKRSVTLKEILEGISSQTGYDFLYENLDPKAYDNFNIKVENADLKDVLSTLLHPRDLTFVIKDRIVIVKSKETSLLSTIVARLLSVDIHGRVLDEKSLPLPGATVRIKGSKRAVVTNVDGRFYFRGVDENAILQIAYLGYKLKDVPAKKELGDINLVPNSAELQEVAVSVSTGLQTLSKDRAAGTIEHVGPEVLAARPNTDLSSMLQGVVAGMQGSESANGKVSFTIRGISTLGTSNNQRSPLIVIDGFPLMNGDFSTINPNDVESVDVLKDATASAIWGARSTNGVIVITTKKGKGKHGFTINASGFTRISRRPDIDQIYTIANAKDQVDYEKLAFEKKIYLTSGVYYQGGIFPMDFDYALTSAQQLMFANQYGRLSTAAMERGLDSLSKIDNRKQIQDNLMRNAVTQQYNVSFSHNSDHSQSYLSLLFEKNKDKFVGNGYGKYGINFANEYKVNRFLSLNFNSFLQYNNNENSGITMQELNGNPTLFGGGISSYELLLNPDKSYVTQVAGVNGGLGGPDPYILSQLPMDKFPYPDWSYNLLREVQGRDLRSTNYTARIQTGLKLNLLSGLTLEAKVQYERGKTNFKNYYSDDTYYVRNMVNTNLEYDHATKTIGRVYLPTGGILQRGSVDRNEFDTDITNYNYRGQLSYVKSVSNNVDINATFGGEVSQYRTDGIINPWLYGYNPRTLTSSVPPYGYGSAVDVFQGGTVTGGTLSSIDGGDARLSYSLDRFVSYFAASDITFKKKYTLSLNIRGDASNYITSDPSLRWSPFWSVGGNWNVKHEKFAQGLNWLDYFHLRASYGSNGTADKSTSTVPLLDIGTSPNPATGTITGSISSFGNPYLHWERTHTLNLGLDFVLFKSKLSGNVNVYNKKSTEVTGTVTLPQAYGTTSQKFNNAGILNRGIELQLSTSLKLPAGLGYSTSVNYAYNYNRITDLYYPTPINYMLTSPGQAFIEGRPVNSFYTYDYAGVDESGMPQLYGLNGEKYGFNSQTLLLSTDGISKGYMHYAGTRTSPHTLGWRNMFTYGSFSLSAQIIGTFGGSFLNPSFNYGSSFVGFGKTAPNRFVRQVLAGDPSVPPLVADPALTIWPRYSPYLSFLVESASYIQLKEIFLSYNLPQTTLRKCGFSSASLFVQARDLGMLWNNNTHNYHPDFLPGADRPVASYTLGFRFGL